MLCLKPQICYSLKKEFKMAFNFTNEVVKFLQKNLDKSFTASEIAEYIADDFLCDCEAKIKKSKGRLKTKYDCIRQWSAEINAHKYAFMKKGVLTTAGRPRKYYIPDDKEETKAKRKNNQPEKELYSVLAQFCKFKKNINTLRINEKRSSNDQKGHNIWLYADVVGYEDLTTNFNNKVKECLVEYAQERSLLYSFEVKDERIEITNLRNFFFQTVSNSSWANYSYLVAEEVADNAFDELQLLCSSFNIGFIQLDKKDPAESQIIIKAPKTPLDWHMINRIASVNKDFQKYLENITLSYKGHSNKYTAKPKWDINEET